MRYEAAMEMIIRANKNTFRKDDTDVCKALEEPFEDRFQEREQKARAEGVLELLEDYGEIPERIREKVFGQKNPAVLKRWLKAAAKTASIEEFERAIHTTNA